MNGENGIDRAACEEEKNNNQLTNAEMKKSLLIIGIAEGLILLIMFLTGILFGHWVISLILLFGTYSAFAWRKKY